MIRCLIAVLSLLPFTAWRADAQAMSRVRPPVKTNCESMPDTGRTIGELCSATSDDSLRYWNGSEWVVIGFADVSSSPDDCRYVHLNATGGDGTKGSPWAGWAEQITSSGNYCFVPGYYDQEEVYWTSSVDNIHIKCEPNATFLRNSALGGFFRSEDSDAGGSGGPSSVSITNFSIEGCTFDYNGFYTGTVGGAINRDSTIGLWRTTGMHSDIVIRNNKWINLGQVAYSFYATAGDSALISVYAGKRFLLEGNQVIDETFTADSHFYAFVWFTAGEDIVIRGNDFYQAGILKLESYDWQLWGNQQKHMYGVVVSGNKFYNIPMTNIILRNTCTIAGEDGPTSIHNILIADNQSYITEQDSYVVTGKGLVGIAATWAPDAYCDASQKAIFSENIIVSNNQMRGMHGNFISVGGEGTLNHYGAVRNLTVIGNVADGAYQEDLTLDETCDYTNPNGLCNSFGFNSNAFESENITVVGNSFKNTYNSCIYVYGSNTTIVGNTCENNVMHENADIFYINAAIIADGDNINISGNTVRNPGDPDHTLDGTNPFQPYGIFVPSGVYTQNAKVTNNLIVDSRDYDIDGDSTIEDVDGDGTVAATDQRAMGYGIRFGTGGSYGEFLQLTGNTIMGAITKAWQIGVVADATVVYGNIVEQQQGGFAIAPSIGEMTYAFDNTYQSCLSVTKNKKIFEDTNCDGIQDVSESGVSDPTPLNSNLYSVGDEADTLPANNPYMLSGTADIANSGQNVNDTLSVATAHQTYDSTANVDLMVNVAAQTDTTNIYGGLIPDYPWTTNFGATVSLTEPTSSAYLIGYAITGTDKDIYSKTYGAYFWCSPLDDVDGDNTAGDEDNDGTCGEGTDDDDDCNWYTVTMDDAADDAGGTLADATNTSLKSTTQSCVIGVGEFQNLSIVFTTDGLENYANFYIDGTLETTHEVTDDNLPGAIKMPFCGIWAQLKEDVQSGFQWDYVGASGYRKQP